MLSPSTPGSRYRWGVLAVVLVATAIGIMTFAAPFSLLTLWVRDLGISRTQGGVLTGLWYLAGTLVALPAGGLADRFPLRRLLLGCWTLNIAGTLLMAGASGLWMLCAGRVIFSIGMAGHLVVAPKLLATWFESRKEFGLVMGLYSMSMTAGVYASLMGLGRVGEHSGWRPAMLLLVALAACGFLLILLLPAQPIAPSAGRAGEAWWPPRVGLAAWVLAAAYGGYNVATEAYLTFSPDYLVRRGYGLAAASAMVAVYAWVALSLKPFVSWFLRKTNGVHYVLGASLIFVFSVVLLLSPAVSPSASAGVMGASMALGMPAFYALPPLLFGSQKSGQVYGLCELFYGLGAIAQPVVGWTIDRTGGYAPGYAVICSFAGLSVFGSLWLISQQRAAAAPAVRPV